MVSFGLYPLSRLCLGWRRRAAWAVASTAVTLGVGVVGRRRCDRSAILTAYKQMRLESLICLRNLYVIFEW